MKNKIKKRIRLIKEGRSFRDKVKIFIWFFGIKRGLYLKNKDGIFYIRPNSSDLWMLSPIGEEEIREYFNLSKGTFFDIGANVGKYSIIIGNQLGKNGKVYSFEPEQSNLKALERNLLLNKIQNVKIIPIACSDKKGNLNFYLNKDNSGGHSLVKKTDKKIVVKSETLDSIVKDKKIKDIKLIKIDVEGAESLVLKGAKKTLKKFHPKIIFEAWSNNYLEKCTKILKPLNYQVKKIPKSNYFAY